jgi:simple sugar transport system substrate-binding protein
MVALSFAACKKEDGVKNTGVTQIAVFIPGVLSGSPTYEMLAGGARKAAGSAQNAEVTVIEAGTVQSEWEAKITAVAASGKYDLIVSSNPSMPDIANLAAEKFPQTRYMIMDGMLDGNPAVYTLNYDKKEQAYALGYLAALLTAEAGGSGVIGLLSAQHYPVLDDIIAPAYLAGAKDADSSSSIDFRITGSWQDPVKALEFAGDMIESGVKVILTIAGGGNDGVVQAAAEKNAKVLWFDSNAYAYRPGVIAGCCATYQDKAVEDKLNEFFNKTLPFGHAETVGFRDGYTGFIDDDPLYISTVSEDIRKKQAAMIEKLLNGDIIPVIHEN